MSVSDYKTSKPYINILYRQLSVQLQHLYCKCTGDTTVLHWAIYTSYKIDFECMDVANLIAATDKLVIMLQTQYGIHIMVAVNLINTESCWWSLFSLIPRHIISVELGLILVKFGKGRIPLGVDVGWNLSWCHRLLFSIYGKPVCVNSNTL